MWQCFAFISGITMLEHPGKQLTQEQSVVWRCWTNTSHLTVSFLCLERILVFGHNWIVEKQLPTSHVQNLSYTTRTIMK